MHIAKGAYQHYDNGIANGVREIWQLTQRDDTYQLAVEFIASYTLTAIIQMNTSWRVTEFSYSTDTGLSGSYHVRGQQLLVKRVLAGNTRLEDILVWSADTILDLPFLCCKGHTILHLDQQGIVPTFAPILQSGDRAGDLAKKSVIKHDEQDTFTVSDAQIETTHYTYLRDYWLDEHGIVIKANDKTYNMILTEYER